MAVAVALEGFIDDEEDKGDEREEKEDRDEEAEEEGEGKWETEGEEVNEKVEKEEDEEEEEEVQDEHGDDDDVKTSNVKMKYKPTATAATMMNNTDAQMILSQRGRTGVVCATRGVVSGMAVKTFYWIDSLCLCISTVSLLISSHPHTTRCGPPMSTRRAWTMRSSTRSTHTVSFLSSSSSSRLSPLLHRVLLASHGWPSAWVCSLVWG
jgi:hypothetical protein